MVRPIHELYWYVVHPQNTREITKFIERLKKREYDRAFRRQADVARRERNRIKKGEKELDKLKAKYQNKEVEFYEVKKFYKALHQPKDYPETHLDEIEES